jgi:hypothetical protein
MSQSGYLKHQFPCSTDHTPTHTSPVLTNQAAFVLNQACMTNVKIGQLSQSETAGTKACVHFAQTTAQGKA